MDVDHPVAGAVDERRQLVHPLAVIEIVIALGGLQPLPARLDQRLLDSLDLGARHEDIEIADAAPRTGVEIGGVEGGALEQDHRHAQGRQRPARHLGLPERLGARIGRVPARGFENRGDAGRHLSPLQSCGEAAAELLGAGGADQAGPVRIGAKAGGIAERADEELPVHAARSRQKLSTRPIAVSVSG